MNFVQRVSSQSWIVVLVIAAGILVWSTTQRVKRIDTVSGLARPATSQLGSVETTSAPSNGHNLIVSERNEPSLHLLLQSQHSLERGERRIRHVDYDNAPQGRPVQSPSAYRWWFRAVAKVDQTLTSQTGETSLERAALWTDPVTQGVLLLFGTVVIASRFGSGAAALFAVGVVTWFPFAASFVPGAPDPRALTRALGVGHVLLVLGALWSQRGTSAWWIAAGVCGGLGLWVDLSTSVPIILGIAAGGLLAGWTLRRTSTGELGELPIPNWRAWSISGAVTVLVCYLVEYAPDHLGDWSLESLHPLYGLAWLGLGELVQRMTLWPNRRSGWASYVRSAVPAALAVIAVAAVPLTIHWSGSHGYAQTDLALYRLTQQPGGVVAQNLRAWFSRDGVTMPLTATLVPLLLLLPAWGLLLTRTLSVRARCAVTFLIGPIFLTGAWALQQLSWWSFVGAMFLLLACVVVAARTTVRWIPASAVIAVLVASALGIPALKLNRFRSADLVLTSPEAEALIERDLAQWIAKHTTEVAPIVFAPPRQSLSFAYFGGLRGIGTFAPENKAGFGTALTLTGVKTMEDVQGIIESRGVRFVVVPSWDPFFDEFAGRYLAESLSARKSFLVSELRRFNLPGWLRPLSYPLPVISGFESQSALVFEVVDPQSPSLAASRLAEYFVEMGDLGRAGQMIETLRKFPGDVGALAAQAQVFKARDNANGLSDVLDSISARLTNGADRFVPWDRRVSLAIVLAHGNRLESARDQAARCISEITEARLRSLSGDALYGLLVLSETFQLPMADQKLRSIALTLVPAELRQHL